MKPDFNNMSKDQLRQYVITHQEDKEAFYIYVDRLKSNPSTQVYSNSLSPQEIDQVVTNHLKEKELWLFVNYQILINLPMKN